MQNIHVKRYKGDVGHWHGTIEPEDSSWILFISSEDRPPSLFISVSTAQENGQTKHVYSPAYLSGDAT